MQISLGVEANANSAAVAVGANCARCGEAQSHLWEASDMDPVMRATIITLSRLVKLDRAFTLEIPGAYICALCDSKERGA